MLARAQFAQLLCRVSLALASASISMAAVQAVQAAVVQPAKPTDVTVMDQKQPQWYYGTLDGAPHTYMLYLDEPLDVSVELLAPKSAETKHHGVIIVKQAARGVTEVIRLEAKSASWESFYDIASAEHYQRGGSYEGTLDGGIYTIEVQSPDNSGPYALRFQKSSSLANVGYVGKLQLLSTIKERHGSSVVTMLLSPYVFFPILVLAGIGWYLFKRKKHA